MATVPPSTGAALGALIHRDEEPAGSVGVSLFHGEIMPSVSAKAEQKTNEGMEHLKQALSLLEKKVRNLEKRKGKLEDYKAKEQKGQELNDEQKLACSRLEEVNNQLEIARELQKQFAAVSQDAEKALKRQLKKEKAERHEEERQRLSEVLQIRSLLDCLRNEPARSAFLQGLIGSLKITDEDMHMLEELHKLLFPERSKGEDFKQSLQISSEHVQSLLDGKEKPILGQTYKQLKDLIEKIESAPFFSGAESGHNEECSEEENTSNNTVEQEFVVVKTSDVPEHDSDEVTAALPPLPASLIPDSIDDNLEESDDQYRSEESITIYNRQSGKAFQDIVSSVQGTFNFLQESEIDVDTPVHSDPAVLQVLPSQPSSFQQPLHAANAGYANTPGVYSTYLTQLPDAAYPADTPQPIPLPHRDGNLTDDNKMFTMNANAAVFESKTQTEDDGDENSADEQGFRQTVVRNSRGRVQNGTRGRGRPNGFRNRGGGPLRGGYQQRSDYNADGYQSHNGGGAPTTNYRRGTGNSRGFNSGRDFPPRGGSWRGNSGRGGRGSYHNESHQQPAPAAEAEA